MPLEYFIEELTSAGKITHSSTFSAAEAGKIAMKVSRRTKNPVSITSHTVPDNQIENTYEMVDDPITVQELFEEIYGKDAKFDEQDSGTKLFLHILSETANEVLVDYKNGVLNVTFDIDPPEKEM